MSYDVYVGCHCCGQDLMLPSGHNNMTSNVSGVWNKAGAPLRDWDGKPVVDILPSLQRAIDRLTDPVMLSYERREYEELIRGGGSWGDYASAVDFLVRIRDACARDPEATLSVSH